jgi:quinol monooxygenase YgiN
MFIVTVRFTVRPGYEERFLEAVSAQRVNSLTREPECNRFDVCVSVDRPRDVFLYEAYASAAAFDAHLRTAHFEDFAAVTKEWIEQKAVDTWTLRGTGG